MAINFRKYIDITSGVIAGVRVKTRDLIGRLYTTNPKCPAGGILEFDFLEDVAVFFGSTSEEYKRAAFYFGWISKSVTRARKLSFVYWGQTDAVPYVRSLAPVASLEELQAVEDGSFRISFGADTFTVTGCNFTGCVAYADVANALQAALRKTSTKPLAKAATVVFEADAAGFTIAAGAAVTCDMQPVSAAPNGTFIGGLLGLDAAANPVCSSGQAGQTVTDLLNASIDASNNFGSFCFIGRDLTVAEAKEAAVITHASNVQFMMCQRVTEADAPIFYEALKGFSGVALVEYDPANADEYPEMFPMIMLAATNYRAKNGTINYMYHQANLTPTVTTTPKSNALDKIRVNYYGRTQQAGQTIDFFQRGNLLGTVQAMNIYANEMWFKDSAAVDVFTLLLALNKVSANNTGRGQIMGCLENTIAQALQNGTISVEKALTYTQRAKITELTGDATAWQQVQLVGYWLGVWVEEMLIDDRVEYKMVYTLVYGKDDVISKVEGSHSLV